MNNNRFNTEYEKEKANLFRNSDIVYTIFPLYSLITFLKLLVSSGSRKLIYAWIVQMQ
jgi:hypothetical protein